MKLWLDDGDLALYHGDATAVLRSLPAGIAQTCICSPPYWGLRDYGTGSWSGGADDCDHQGRQRTSDSTTIGRSNGAGQSSRAASMTLGAPYRDVCGMCGARRVDDQLGLEATPDLYVERLVAVMREVWRVLRADGTLWLNLGDSYNAARNGGWAGGKGALNEGRDIDAIYQGRSGANVDGLKAKDLVGVPWRVAFALQADGWYLRSDIIWAKPNPMPESVTDRPTKSHEYVFLLAKQPRYYYDADAVREDSTGNGGPRIGAGARGGPSVSGAPRQYDASNGRNVRSVWEIATQPTPEAHFATYPEALVRRCILAGTSERGECVACGAPWQRQVDRVLNPQTGLTPKNTELVERGLHGAGARLHGPGWRNAEQPSSVTTGWAASCACGAPPVAQTVLDPFVGSGTTALVARKHGRRAIGIDLSAEYLAIAARRTAQQSLLGGAA